MSRPKGSIKTPSLTHHKASGRAVVRIDGKDEYCGPWGSAEAQQKYERLVAEWVLRGRQPAPADAPDARVALTVSQVIAAFWTHATSYYGDCVLPGGKIAGELDNYRLALRPLRRLYGTTSATELGPLALKALQRDMAAPKQVQDRKTGKTMERPGWCRTNINRAITRIKTAFKWGVGNELIPPHIYQGIAAVPGLRAGRSPARENDRVMPADDRDVERAFQCLSAGVAFQILPSQMACWNLRDLSRQAVAKNPSSRRFLPFSC